MKQGQIIRINAGFYDIISDNKEYRTRGSGNLRNSGVTPLVGDFVNFEPDGFLLNVLERKNFLNRPKVANLDQVIVITSLIEPKYSSLLLNKFLAIIEFNNIEPIIVFTKKDLTKDSYLQEYIDQGYKTFEISNKDKDSLMELKPIFKNKLSVFTGQTGAGKSTTINSLTNLNLKTQKISKSLGRGKHTTRVVQIYDWFGGRLIDTPGFSSLEFNLTKLQLANSYKDFKNLATKCKFKNCLHSKEPNCKVIDKVNKTISINRYNDYIKILKECPYE
ncbi:MAG: ribosome small subunit-dependent GTPase A [Mycoplasma sp.]|nr:ribosome small subunit-dependent GTPase A [Mycoplasma sp.]